MQLRLNNTYLLLALSVFCRLLATRLPPAGVIPLHQISSLARLEEENPAFFTIHAIVWKCPVCFDIGGQPKLFLLISTTALGWWSLARCIKVMTTLHDPSRCQACSDPYFGTVLKLH
jgi:hypothetical protein